MATVLTVIHTGPAFKIVDLRFRAFIENLPQETWEKESEPITSSEKPQEKKEKRPI